MSSTSLHTLMQGSCERQVVFWVLCDLLEECGEMVGPVLATGDHKGYFSFR